MIFHDGIPPQKSQKSKSSQKLASKAAPGGIGNVWHENEKEGQQEFPGGRASLSPLDPLKKTDFWSLDVAWSCGRAPIVSLCLAVDSSVPCLFCQAGVFLYSSLGFQTSYWFSHESLTSQEIG